jgi:hypothetical protein
VTLLQMLANRRSPLFAAMTRSQCALSHTLRRDDTELPAPFLIGELVDASTSNDKFSACESHC